MSVFLVCFWHVESQRLNAPFPPACWSERFPKSFFFEKTCFWQSETLFLRLRKTHHLSSIVCWRKFSNTSLYVTNWFLPGGEGEDPGSVGKKHPEADGFPNIFLEISPRYLEKGSPINWTFLTVDDDKNALFKNPNVAAARCR